MDDSMHFDYRSPLALGLALLTAVTVIGAVGWLTVLLMA